MNTIVKPKLRSPLHWAGGKRQLLPELLKRVPKTFDTYYEPFLGGGALLFELQPEKAVVNDINTELVNLYRILKYKYSREDMLSFLGTLDSLDEKQYYFIRDWDRNFMGVWDNLQPYKKAARTLYLNRACFNGLYRVNSDGYFNAPWGKHKRASNYDTHNLTLVGKYLEDVSLLNLDFVDVVKTATENDYVFF